MKRHAWLTGLFIVVLAAAVWSLPPGPLMAQAPGGGSHAARTPWGDPDLQGDWSAGYLLTPLERPAKFGTREFLTDDEVTELSRI